jgi:hypothetical protein
MPEILAWLDRYLGKVGSAHAPGGDGQCAPLPTRLAFTPVNVMRTG